VLSFSAILDTAKPLLTSDQTAFWLWLSGEDREQLGLISPTVNKKIFTNI
jgi:hypothetical protein